MTVLVSFSGGADSVYLAIQFLDKKTPVCLVYFDHQLRPQLEREAEQQFVKDFAKKYQLDLICKKIPVQKYAERHRVSIETAGRLLRRRLLVHYAKCRCISKIATAHHLDDICETVFFRLIRGSLTKIGDIQETQEVAPGISLVRPLLALKKEDILKELKNREIVFSEDSSNLSDMYDRNKIRNQICRVAGEVNSKYQHHIRSFLDHYQSLQEMLYQAISKSLDQIVVADGEVSLSLAVFQDHNEFESKQIIYDCMSRLVPEFASDHVQLILDAIQAKKRTFSIDLPGNYRGIIARESLFFVSDELA